MFTFERLTQVYESSKELLFDNSSKIILLSDCHRGDNSTADDFAPNESIFLTALEYYYLMGYTYFELGDADELWQFNNFSEILKSHQEVFRWLRKFQDQKRYFIIWGNHDIVKQDPKFWKNQTSGKDGGAQSLFNQIEAYESLILRHASSGDKILLIHGHQVDPINDQFWRFGRFLARYLWRPLETYLGIADPISPAKNHRKKNTIEVRLTNWVKAKQQAIIAGHTHRPVFPESGGPPYFNCGSSVHPDGITGIEIAGGKIALVKWCVNEKKGISSFISRNILAGPEQLSVFF